MIPLLFLIFSIFLTGCNSAPSDTKAPLISEVRSETITLHSATITWGTDEAADGQVEYGTTAGYGSSAPPSAPGEKAHRQSIAGLEPGTRYHYRVLSRDAAGNVAVSADNTFMTLSSAVTPPPATVAAPPAPAPVPAPLPEERVSKIRIPDFTTPSAPSGLTAAPTSPGQVNLSWRPSTDDFGVAGYQIYRNGRQVGTTTTTGYSDRNLAASTSYRYSVAAYDAAGNVSAQSETVSAATPATADSGPQATAGTKSAAGGRTNPPGSPLISPKASADTAAPTAPSGLTAVAVSPSQVNIAWNGSTDNVGVAGYRLYRDGVEVGATGIQIYSDSRLDPDTVYRYWVRANDAAGNLSAQSNEASIRTPSAFSGVGAGRITPQGATITWSSAEPMTSQVEYGTTAAYGTFSHPDGGLSTTHAVGLTGLTASTSYHYRVIGRDAAGHAATSADQTLRTADPPAPSASPAPTGATTDRLPPAK